MLSDFEKLAEASDLRTQIFSPQNSTANSKWVEIKIGF